MKVQGQVGEPDLNQNWLWIDVKWLDKYKEGEVQIIEWVREGIFEDVLTELKE